MAKTKRKAGKRTTGERAGSPARKSGMSNARRRMSHPEARRAFCRCH